MALNRKTNRRLKPKNFKVGDTRDDYRLHPTKGFRRDSKGNRHVRRIGEAKLQWFKSQGKKHGEQKEG